MLRRRILLRIDPEEKLAARERKILALLNAWPWRIGGTLIGGYAIAAYGNPRYSKDADIVIPTSLTSSFETFLQEQGFQLEDPNRINLKDFEGNVPRYSREEVALDLLVGYVRDRRAKVDVPEMWISQRSRSMVLNTITGVTAIPVSVARPEALWALKLQTGRDQDIIDLYAIQATPIDMYEIISLFRSLHSESLTEKLSLTSKNVTREKLFEDAMSRMGTKRNESNRIKWNSFAERVKYVVGESIRD
jgi:hypothetical protein